MSTWVQSVPQEDLVTLGSQVQQSSQKGVTGTGTTSGLQTEVWQPAEVQFLIEQDELARQPG